jgi:hypothetical protein
LGVRPQADRPQLTRPSDVNPCATSLKVLEQRPTHRLSPELLFQSPNPPHFVVHAGMRLPLHEMYKKDVVTDHVQQLSHPYPDL